MTFDKGCYDDTHDRNNIAFLFSILKQWKGLNIKNLFTKCYIIFHIIEKILFLQNKTIIRKKRKNTCQEKTMAKTKHLLSKISAFLKHKAK